MKIIQVVLGKANPERMNGVNKVAHHLATALTELGHEVTLWGIASNTRHDYPPRNYRTVLFRQLPQKWKLDPALRRAADQLDEGHVVHLHGSFIPEFYWLARRLQARGIPYVYTPHGALTRAAMARNGLVKKWYFRLFESRILKHARSVQLLGIQEYRYLDELLMLNNKCLIPNGIDLTELPDVRPVFPQTDELVFGFCGRLDRYHKGLDRLFGAFRHYLNWGMKGRIELIGDGPDRRWLEERARALGFADRIVFYGARYGEEKYRLMARAHVFVHTSRMEGFPMAVLEAAGLGLPCLTTEPTNINSYIRQYGAGFPVAEPGDPIAITDAMARAREALQNRQLAAYGQRARHMAETAFDWKHIAGQLAQVYAGHQPEIPVNESQAVAHAS